MKVNFYGGGGLDIIYRSKKIERICKSFKVAEKAYGQRMAEKIHQRIDEITAIDTVELMIQLHIGRCHSLVNNRKGQYAVDLVHPYRLIFEKIGDEIQIVNIIEIIDYH